MLKYSCGVVIAALTLIAAPAEAQDISGPARALAQSQIKGWVSNPLVVNAIKAENAEHAGLSQADIDKLDKQWRAETGASSRPLIDGVMNNALSKYLRKIKADGKGLYTEIFVMDDRGLNIGVSDITSDYWQGDEDKWQSAYNGGPNDVHIGEIEQDESTQMFQSQISLPVVDPASSEVIGTVTVGVDVDQLMQ